jgi:ArsR family transcriptional regulator
VIEATTIEPLAPAPADSRPLLAVAADPVRWRLLTVLADGGTHCVCELQPVAGVAPNVLSYHLKVLREAGLVTAAKRGRWVDYTLADDAHARLAAALPTAGTGPVRHAGAGG